MHRFRFFHCLLSPQVIEQESKSWLFKLQSQVLLNIELPNASRNTLYCSWGASAYRGLSADGEGGEEVHFPGIGELSGFGGERQTDWRGELAEWWMWTANTQGHVMSVWSATNFCWNNFKDAQPQTGSVPSAYFLTRQSLLSSTVVNKIFLLSLRNSLYVPFPAHPSRTHSDILKLKTEMQSCSRPTFQLPEWHGANAVLKSTAKWKYQYCWWTLSYK